MLDVPELVRDDEAHLVRREAREQRVVEHDALGVAEPAHVRVGGRRAPGRVDDEHVTHVDAGPARELLDVGPRAPGRQVPVAVQHRVEHHRRQPHEQRPRCTRRRPRPRPTTRAGSAASARRRAPRRRPPAATAIPLDVSRSPPHSAHDCVDLPKSTARSCAPGRERQRRDPVTASISAAARECGRRAARPRATRSIRPIARRGGRRTSSASTAPWAAIAPRPSRRWPPA